MPKEPQLRYDDRTLAALQAAAMQLADDQSSHAELSQIDQAPEAGRFVMSVTRGLKQFERDAPARVLAHREKMERKRQERAKPAVDLRSRRRLASGIDAERRLPYVHGGYGLTFRSKAQWAEERGLKSKGRI